MVISENSEVPRAAILVVLARSTTVEHSARKTKPRGPAEEAYAATQMHLHGSAKAQVGGMIVWVTQQLRTHAKAIMPEPVADVCGTLRIPPIANRSGTMSAPIHSRSGRRPNFSVVNREVATEMTSTVLRLQYVSLDT